MSGRGSTIFSALHDNNLLVLKKLLDEGEDVNRQDSEDQERTILHKACMGRKPAAVKLILKYKPKLDLKDKSLFGQTPLHYSCGRGDLESVRLLLENNPDINIGDNANETPLYYASDNNHLDIVKLLLDRGANPNIVNRYFYCYTGRRLVRLLKCWLPLGRTLTLQTSLTTPH